MARVRRLREPMPAAGAALAWAGTLVMRPAEPVSRAVARKIK